jgi:hypothetical protein
MSKGLIVFPAAPKVAGVYRMLLRHGSTFPTGIYIGETDHLRRRLQHYRTPGPTQSTNIRINAAIVESLAAAGTVELDIITHATIVTSEETEQLDLSWKSARVLLERAAEVSARSLARACPERLDCRNPTPALCDATSPDPQPVEP